MLADFEDEFYRRGNWNLVFPVADKIGYYGKFFESVHYNNLITWKYLVRHSAFLDKYYTREENPLTV
jgi:hypothetical protein